MLGVSSVQGKKWEWGMSGKPWEDLLDGFHSHGHPRGGKLLESRFPWENSSSFSDISLFFPLSLFSFPTRKGPRESRGSGAASPDCPWIPGSGGWRCSQSWCSRTAPTWLQVRATPFGIYSHKTADSYSETWIKTQRGHGI